MALQTKKSDWGRFQPVSRDERYRIIGGSQGPGGSGKTHFWLTAPEPIAVMLFDPIGLEGLVSQPLFREKDIRVIEYNFQPGKVGVTEERAKQALEELERFHEDYQIALKHARSIIWDKEDHIWEMVRYARNEDFSAAPATYYELNLEYRGFFSDAADAGVNLGVIRGMKEVWGSRPKPNGGMQPYATGKFEARGQKEVPELVQVYLDHRWDDEQRAFMTKIHEKCRIGNATEMIGTEHANLDFLTLAMLLYPETVDTPEVWE